MPDNSCPLTTLIRIPNEMFKIPPNFFVKQLRIQRNRHFSGTIIDRRYTIFRNFILRKTYFTVVLANSSLVLALIFSRL